MKFIFSIFFCASMIALLDFLAASVRTNCIVDDDVYLFLIWIYNNEFTDGFILLLHRNYWLYILFPAL